MSETREEKRLRRDCAELYQVIGTLAVAHADLFEHPEVIKALDNADAAAHCEPRPHDDLLPFAPISSTDPMQEAESRLAAVWEEAAEIAEKFHGHTSDPGSYWCQGVKHASGGIAQALRSRASAIKSGE